MCRDVYGHSMTSSIDKFPIVVEKMDVGPLVCHWNGRKSILFWENERYTSIYINLEKLKISNAVMDNYLLQHKISGMLWVHGNI